MSIPVIPEHSKNGKKTSEEWQRLYPKITVLDPDGWDRQNYQFSWHEELVTLEGYRNRLFQSTCEFGVRLTDGYLNQCVSDCPACAVEANNKAWAKYLTGCNHDDGGRVTVYVPSDDWEQIKKLAEEG